MPKRKVAPLVGRKVRLRLLEQDDLATTLRWRNHETIRPWFLNSDVIPEAAHQQWFNGYRERDDDFVFVIEDIEELQAPVGQASVYRVDADRKTAEFGRLVIGEPAARGRGLAREAVDLLTAFAFTELGLAELTLQLKTDNTIAGALYESCGYRVIDRRDGIIDMTLTENEWRAGHRSGAPD